MKSYVLVILFIYFIELVLIKYYTYNIYKILKTKMELSNSSDNKTVYEDIPSLERENNLVHNTNGGEYNYLDLKKIKLQKSITNDVCLQIEHDVLNSYKTHVKVTGYRKTNYPTKYSVPGWEDNNFLLVEFIRQNSKNGPLVRSTHDENFFSSSVKISKLFLPVSEILLILESIVYLRGEFEKMYEALNLEEKGLKVIKTQVTLCNDKEKFMSLEGTTYNSSTYKYYLDLNEVKPGLKNTAQFSIFVANYLVTIKDQIIQFDHNCLKNKQEYLS